MITHFLVVGLLLAAVDATTPVKAQAVDIKKAATVLQGYYTESTGLYSTTGWWNSANALTAIIQYAARSGDRSFDSVIQNTFSKHSSYLNDYYDDEGWWALAWIEAYKYTKNSAYLKMAETIFTDISGGWDNTCGGGVWWSRKKAYKNAIPNELFLQVASSLHLLTSNAQYLQWAQREWDWFNKTGMISANHLIVDGLTTACKPNAEQQWTYNQGVVLGGLVNLYLSTKNQVYLNQANQIASAAITILATTNGVLREPCEPHCGGGDVPQFKGVFMRNLGYLYEQTKDAKYSKFIQENANSIWNADQNDGKLGLIWYGPFDSADAARQSSALDALNANLLV